MNIGWPEGIYIGLTVVGLLATASMNGKPRTGEHNFAVTLVLAACSFGLLYWGGFFA